MDGPVRYHCGSFRSTGHHCTQDYVFSQTSTFLPWPKLKERGSKGVSGCFDSEEMPCLARLEHGRGAGRGAEILVIMGTTSINPSVKTRALS